MGFFHISKRFRAPDLQAKVILILIAVIFPVSIFLGLAQSRVMEPVLFDEIRQVGLSFAQNLSAQIEAQRLLLKPNASQLIEDKIQRMVYAHPGIIRVDVISKRPGTGALYYLASNIEEQESLIPPESALKDQVTAELEKEDEIPVWNIYYPLKVGSERAMIHVLVSLRFLSGIQSTVLKINIIAAILSTILLILILSFLLKRAIENEKQLKVAQESNAVLSGRLQETQQALIHTEKLAVMGQLTASFAHEIGTPLNAISGHMQLLQMSLEKLMVGEAWKSVSDRLGIISGQLKKIENIVKGFLQTTKKPIAQQKSLVPVRELVDSVFALVQPTLQYHQVSYSPEFRARMGMIEVVPLEIEQVILNLVNNAVDSMKERGVGSSVKNELRVRTYNDLSEKYVIVEIQDNGMGISEVNLKQIFKPFFTTKSAGEGHGLGLSICQQILNSYGGEVLVDSRVGQGTRVRMQIPVAG
jgi:hypothetical protein